MKYKAAVHANGEDILNKVGMVELIYSPKPALHSKVRLMVWSHWRLTQLNSPIVVVEKPVGAYSGGGGLFETVSLAYGPVTLAICSTIAIALVIAL